MTIYKKIIIIVIGIVIITNVTNKVFKNGHIADINELHGKLLIEPPIDGFETEEDGLVICDFDNGTKEKILDNYNSRLITDLCFDKNCENVLFCINKSIFEYNIASNKCEIIKEVEGSLDSANYIGNTSYIAYTSSKKLFLFDRENKIDVFISELNDRDEYTCSFDGKTLLYNPLSDSKSIYSYDIKTKENKKLFNGYKPICSSDGMYIAYFEDSEHFNIIVKEIATGKEFYHRERRKFDMRFVPNSSQIAFFKAETIPFPQEFVIWNFETDNEKKLFNKIPYNVNFDWK